MLSGRNRSLCCCCSVCRAYEQRVCMDQWLLKGLIGIDRQMQGQHASYHASLFSFSKEKLLDRFWQTSRERHLSVFVVSLGGVIWDCVKMSPCVKMLFIVVTDKQRAAWITRRQLHWLIQPIYNASGELHNQLYGLKFQTNNWLNLVEPLKLVKTWMHKSVARKHLQCPPIKSN